MRQSTIRQCFLKYISVHRLQYATFKSREYGKIVWFFFDVSFDVLNLSLWARSIRTGSYINDQQIENTEKNTPFCRAATHSISPHLLSKIPSPIKGGNGGKISCKGERLKIVVQYRTP